MTKATTKTTDLVAPGDSAPAESSSAESSSAESSSAESLSAEQSCAEPSPLRGLRPGQIKWYSVHRGYGFLNADQARDLPVTDHDPEQESADVFVHHSLLGEHEDLVPGERVLFAAKAGPKGLLATHLERLG